MWRKLECERVLRRLFLPKQKKICSPGPLTMAEIIFPNMFQTDLLAFTVQAVHRLALYKIVFEDSGEQDRLAEMIEKVTKGAFESVAVEFTNTPKHEVSYGLLVDKFGATDLSVEERSHETVLGEEILSGKNELNFMKKLNTNGKVISNFEFFKFFIIFFATSSGSIKPGI